MSNHEKAAWASLVASLLVWSFFTMRMTAAGVVVDVSVRHMIWTYGAVVVLMIVSSALIAALFASRDGDAPLADERDLAIEAKADRIEGYVVLVAVNVLVIHLLATAAYPGHIFTDIRVYPDIRLDSLPAQVYALISVLFAAHMAGRIATIWQYRV